MTDAIDLTQYACFTLQRNKTKLIELVYLVNYVTLGLRFEFRVYIYL